MRVGIRSRRGNALASTFLACLVALTGCGGGTDTTPGGPPVSAPAGSPTGTTTPGFVGEPSPSDPVIPTEPLSPFEDDPAVKVLRLHYLGSAIGVNHKSMRNKQLLASSTPRRLKLLPSLFDFEYGDRYPGPIPITPLAVVRRGSAIRIVSGCVLADGWLRDAKTGRPTKKRRLQNFDARIVRTTAGWRVDMVTAGAGSCAGVEMREVFF